MQLPAVRFITALPRASTCILIFLLLAFPAFTGVKASQATAPAQVQLVSPGDGSTTYASADQPKALPRFGWTPIAGAAAYRLEISADASFDPAGLLVEVPSTPFSTWTPVEANLPDDVLLYWRVRVEEQAGTTEKGEYSPVWSFRKDWRRTGPELSARNAATLLLPEDGASMVFSDPPGGEIPPAFSWTPVLGATHYVFQVAQETDFASLFYSETTLSTRLQLANKLADGTYYWRVVPVQAGVPLQGHPGDYRLVTVNYHAQFLPQLLEPADQAEVTFNPTFRWTGVRGAQKYILQYSADSSFPPAQTTQVETFANRYAPPEFVDNHTRYYWRVRVVSGNSNAPEWTPFFSFVRIWGQKPDLLTPANDFLYANDPFFTWTPVPGAANYTLAVDDNAGFSSPLLVDDITVPFYAFPDPLHNCPPYAPDLALPDPMRVFWRVTPRDASDQPGEPSDTWTFVCDPAAGAPVQVYPNMFFPPVAGSELNPRTENTSALPAFVWKRVLNGAQKTQSDGYRIQVADAPEFAPGSIRYSLDTKNMHAVPAQAGLLPHGSGETDYFWRVRPLTNNGVESGQWSQTWRMRYNPARLPTATSVIQPLRPAAASEWVETVPLFEWMPLQNATSYRIQFSLDSDFHSVLGTYPADFPAYSHPDRLDAGTYYWRVLGLNGSSQLGDWSEPTRFHIAAQSRWRSTRTLGANNTPEIATDPLGDAGEATYDLTSLSVTQGGSNWYFGFKANAGANMRYAIYIDTNRIPSAATFFDPKNYDITPIPAHFPEVVIYIDKINGMVNADSVFFYTLDVNLGVWHTQRLLSDLADSGITFNSTTGYLELTLRGSSLALSAEKKTMSVSVVSFLLSGGRPQDSLPSDPNIHPGGSGSSLLSRFVTVSDQVTLLTPPFPSGGGHGTFTTVPAFAWQPLVEVPEVGFYTLRVGTDPNLTSWISAANHTKAPIYTFTDDLAGDGTYYWQVRPADASGLALGRWSQAGTFTRRGMPALDLSIANDLWTPVLSWSKADGAYNYDVQIDDDTDFTDLLVLSAITKMNTYIPDSITFPSGKPYYARIRANQTATIHNPVSNVVSFTPQRPQVTGLHTIPETSTTAPALYNPSFCWNPVVSAWKYRVEISTDASFTHIDHDGGLTEEPCYTIPIGLLDGAYYWRVSMLDGSLQPGLPSPAARFWKRYPAPALLYPLEAVEGTPIFRWSAVAGSDRYLLQISDTPSFSVIRYEVTTTNNEHQPNQKLDFGSYYWRVKMIDRDHVEGPFSDYYTAYKCFLPAIRK